KKYLSKLSDRLFILEVFEKNLKEILNDNRRFTLPNFEFFCNENFSLRFNFFLKNEKIRFNDALHLIHDHGNNILTTKMIFGQGYKSINFKKSKNNLEIQKRINHKLNNSYTIKEYTPHLVFNVSDFSVSINLWTKGNGKVNRKDRLNYYLKDNKYFQVKDSELIDYEISKITKTDDKLILRCFLYWLNSLGFEKSYLVNKLPELYTRRNDLFLEPKLYKNDSNFDLIMNYNDF
ncbi:hypothetical protein N9L07_01445, partial [Flavobacteriaceae bacterium]|nr:hypothetical protein [Flavobacteriaceae bacterium]